MSCCRFTLWPTLPGAEEFHWPGQPTQAGAASLASMGCVSSSVAGSVQVRWLGMQDADSGIASYHIASGDASRGDVVEAVMSDVGRSPVYLAHRRLHFHLR